MALKSMGSKFACSFFPNFLARAQTCQLLAQQQFGASLQRVRAFASEVDSLKYAASHEWVKVDGDVATLGVTDHKFKRMEVTEVCCEEMVPCMGEVRVPEWGNKLVPTLQYESVPMLFERTRGEDFGCLNVDDWNTDSILMYSPVSGKIVEINQSLTDDPTTLNSDPYGTWIAKIKMSNPSELDNLMDSKAYEESVKDLHYGEETEGEEDGNFDEDACGAWDSASLAAASPDQKYRDVICNEILDASPGVSWDSIAGLEPAKRALQEAVILPTLRPDLFSGSLRSPCRGLLLYGPPGNGKTMLGKALASEAGACFFSISASSLTNMWWGEDEKLVRALFAVAAEKAPSIIFFDEIDSRLCSRTGNGVYDNGRGLKSEFLTRFDGVAAAPGSERVVVVGATNRPQDLDVAVRRRLVKRIYIPLPDREGRMAVLSHLLQGQPHSLKSEEMGSIVQATEGYSASDLTALTKEAAMGPIREIPISKLVHIEASALRPIAAEDFKMAMQVIKSSTDTETLAGFEDFTRAFGTGG